MKNYLLIGFVTILLLGSCSTTIKSFPNSKEQSILATHMLNLSPAIDDYFIDLPEATIEDDKTILQKATNHDPSLLAPFPSDTYLLKINYQNPYAVVLLCTKSGERAILEDAGCTERLDRRVIKIAPCEFTIKVSQNCLVKGADLQ